jgi:hypothetical protein
MSRVLFLAAWSGARRTLDPKYASDPACYLRMWGDSFTRYAHQIDRVVVVAPDCPNESPVFVSALADIGSVLRHPRVEVIRRPNVGMSYGSWSHAYGKLRGGERYDWWFLFEDDQIPARGGWDGDLVEMFQAKPDACFLGSIVRHGGGGHIGIGWGVTNADSMEKTWLGHDGHLPHDRGTGGTLATRYRRTERRGNIYMYRGFRNATGGRLYDVHDRYRVGYAYPDCHIEWYFPENTQTIVVPAQGYLT